MTAVYWFLLFFIMAAVLEGITIGVILTPWGRRKVVERVMRLAEYGHAESRDILNGIKRNWRS